MKTKKILIIGLVMALIVPTIIGTVSATQERSMEGISDVSEEQGTPYNTRHPCNPSPYPTGEDPGELLFGPRWT